jgi:hypothetical protein
MRALVRADFDSAISSSVTADGDAPFLLRLAID